VGSAIGGAQAMPLVFSPLVEITRLWLNSLTITLQLIAQTLSDFPNLGQPKMCYAGCIEPVDTPRPQLSITELTLECRWEHNLVLYQLVCLCPKLESLRIQTFHALVSQILVIPSTDLFRNLQEFCPRLNSMRTVILDDIEWGDLAKDDHLNLL
jgi:hypothetical protein